MADISQIKLPNGTTYTLKDEGALQLTGGNVTGPVSFGDSVSIDDLNAGQLVVGGSASVTNNLQVNTINGVTVGSSPKFTDSDSKVTQSASTTASWRKLLLHNLTDSAATDTVQSATGQVYAAVDISAQPSTGTIQATNFSGKINNVTVTAAATGFTIAGGTTSKTLTVSGTYTLGAACAKGVTDNTASTAVTSSDTNLITGRTLYYAGYTKNTGTITSVKTTAGAHTTINVTSGAANFNVPTTAAHVGIKFGYTTDGNNRAVLQDSSGNLYVTQKDNNTTYSAGTGLSLSSTTFSVKTGYTTDGNNRKVQADSDGNLYVIQKDTNTAVTNTTVTTATTYYLTGGGASTATGGLNKHGSIYAYVSADTSTDGVSRLYAGNNTASGTAGAKYGTLRLFSKSTSYVDFVPQSNTSAVTLTLPSSGGTLARTADLPSTTSKAYTNFTVYRYGKVRALYVTKLTSNGSLGTLDSTDRPPIKGRSSGKIYNGSSYVDCAIFVNTNGDVGLTSPSGSAISGAQIAYETVNPIVYIVS